MAWAAAAGALASFAGNAFSSAINSSRSWKYAQRAMALQDQYQRGLMRDQYQLNREGLEKAGYNPLLALDVGGANSNVSPSFMNSDSDNGQQAVQSAMDALRVKDEHKINDATKDKLDAETDQIKLENRIKQSELNTSPKKIISDFVEGNPNPVANKIKSLLKKQGIDVNSVTSANSSKNNTKQKIEVKLHNGKPFVQKGVPRSVVKSFNNSFSNSAVKSQKNYDSLLGIWNSNKKVKGHIMSDSEIRNYRGSHKKYSRPPKNFPSGM